MYQQGNHPWRVVKLHDRWVRRIMTETKCDAERLVEPLHTEPKPSVAVPHRDVPSFCDGCPHKTKEVR